MAKRDARRRLASAAMWLAVAAGCGGEYDASVRGVITLDGNVLPRGMVKYIPSQPGPSGYGVIDASGAYSIVTGREEGLPSGEYVVTVVANEVSVADKNPSAPPVPGKPLTPTWYREKDASPLKKKVERGANEINLELTSTPPPGWKASSGGR